MTGSAVRAAGTEGVAEVTAAAATPTTEATEGPAAMLAAPRAAARTGELEAATPDTASLVAVDSRTTAAGMAGEPAVTAVAAVIVAAAAAPGANSAAAVEEAVERAATTSAGEATATKRAAEKSRLNNQNWMIVFLPEFIF